VCAFNAHIRVVSSVPESVPKRGLKAVIRQPTPTTKAIQNGPEINDLRPVSGTLSSLSKPLYAALWKSSIWRIQLVSGFHLGKIWATISKSLILNDRNRPPTP
jgi:hypothetical protein